jgi:hypothetical protein
MRKVIFASGGITTGKEAREALKAGASVAMMYTGVRRRGSLVKQGAVTGDERNGAVEQLGAGVTAGFFQTSWSR